MDTIEVTKSDLRHILRAMDSALSEIEAGVADGNIDERVLVELSEATDCLQQVLQGN